jgi:FkbM family methyltransferase
MGGFKRLTTKYLPNRILKSFAYYKAYPKNKEEKIHQYIDEESVKYLKSYKNLRAGDVNILGSKIMFSDAGALLHSVEELFCDETYAFHASKENPYIIDCGANIGLSVAYFKKQYPEARILAFEPDKEIFKLLTANVASLGLSNVTLENKAVWNKTEDLTFYKEGALAGSLTIDFSSKNSRTIIPAIALLPYINEPIDFLKIDIEGAENEVMEHIAPNLSFVENLFIEYHSDKNKPQDLHKLLTIVSKAGFRYYIKEASNLTYNPYMKRPKGAFDLQLNVSCYR